MRLHFLLLFIYSTDLGERTEALSSMHSVSMPSFGMESVTHHHNKSCKHRTKTLDSMMTHKHHKSCKHKTKTESMTHKHNKSCKHKTKTESMTHKHNRSCKHKTKTESMPHKHNRSCKHKTKSAEHKHTKSCKHHKTKSPKSMMTHKHTRTCKHHTASVIIRPGEKGKHEMRCGVRHNDVRVAMNDNITSPNYPDEYEAFSSCVIELKPPMNTEYVLKCEEVHLGYGSSLKIYSKREDYMKKLYCEDGASCNFCSFEVKFTKKMKMRLESCMFGGKIRCRVFPS